MASASDLASDRADLKGRVLELLCIRGQKMVQVPGVVLQVSSRCQNAIGNPVILREDSQGWLRSNDQRL